jgi:hypothetical protein
MRRLRLPVLASAWLLVFAMAPRPARGSGGSALRIGGLTLPDEGAVDLELERFDLLTPDFRFLLDGREAPLPPLLRDGAILRGRVAGRAESRVVLLLDGAGGAGGVVAVAGRRYEVSGGIGSLVASESAPDDPEGLADCDVRTAPPAARAAAAAPAATRRAPVQVPVGLYGARVLVESDYEFFQRYGGSDVDQATAILVKIFAEISAILEPEVGVRLEVAQISLWQTPDDPWFDERWWDDYLAAHPVDSYPRAFVHLVTGQRTGGGVLGGVCGAYLASPWPGYEGLIDWSWSWPEMRIVAHEIGHVLGSDHTHCYGFPLGGILANGLDPGRGPEGLPPVDMCWNREDTCWTGAPSIPPDGGSIMSYCAHVDSYGAPGRYGDRSERVLAVMRANLDRADRSFPSCLVARSDALDLGVESAAGSVATLAWNDIFADEIGWTLEQLGPKGWKAVRRVAAGATRVELRGLRAGRAQSYRVLARFRGNVSEPSVPVTLTP